MKLERIHAERLPAVALVFKAFCACLNGDITQERERDDSLTISLLIKQCVRLKPVA